MPPQSELEAFARTAEQMVRTSPAYVSELPFATASKVCGGVLQTAHAPIQSGPVAAGTGVRLKAIECPDGTLLEHTYDKDGNVVRTDFADGGCVKYDWAHKPHQRKVSLPGGKAIILVVRNGGRFRSITYDERWTFRQECVGEGLWQTTYPDGEAVRWAYNSDGLPCNIDWGEWRCVYCWDIGEAGPRVECEYGSARSVIGPEMSARVSLIPLRKLPTGEVVMFSAMGVWICSPGGELLDLRLPDGQRLCIRPRVVGPVDSTWNSIGQSAYEYDGQSVLSAATDPDGSRAMYYRVAGTGHAYLVTSAGAALCEYDSMGRLRRIRSGDGQYASLTYARDGNVKRVSTSRGWMALRQDNGRLTGIRLGSSVTGEIAYGSDGQPTAVSIRARGQRVFVAAMAVCTVLWQWTSLRGVLRLKGGSTRLPEA